MTTFTFRDVAWVKIVDTLYESIGGSPWTDEFESDLDAFKSKLDAAIDAVPSVAEVLDKVSPEPPAPRLPF